MDMSSGFGMKFLERYAFHQPHSVRQEPETEHKTENIVLILSIQYQKMCWNIENFRVKSVRVPKAFPKNAQLSSD
jgi:hypothetical protein